MAWHGSCYKLRQGDSYPIAALQDSEELDDPKEQNKFKSARAGDHLMCPFQCDLCHFRNIHKRDPVRGIGKDARLLMAIRRANLDSFWARSEHTVTGNRNGAKQLMRIASDNLGIGGLIFPEMGPHKLEDNWGMGVATCILEKTLEPGLYGPNVQFSTARKLRSGFANAWGASQHALTMGVMARDKMKTFVTQCPTFSLWFERFISGMHSRMGDIRRPDTAISGKVMHQLMKRVDVDFYDTEDVLLQRFVIRAGYFFLAAYLGSLRGEEVPRVLRKHFCELNVEALASTTPHCVLPLYGRFKNDKGVPRCYLFRITAKSKSGLNMEKWTRRIMESEARSETVYLFANLNGSKESGAIYEPYLFAKLKAIQEEERGLIPKSLEVAEAYGISRSFRRGSVTEAGNAPNDECNDMDIRRNNRWRSEDRAGTREAGLDMLQLYTDTMHSVEADLKFSRCL